MERHNTRQLSARNAIIARHGFGYDGSDYVPLPSHEVSAIGLTLQADTCMLQDSPDVAVPDDVDCRGAYGRRRTRDFGYPGARIKPAMTPYTYAPLQSPDKWAKRACGHFSYMDTNESRENVSQDLCRSCLMKRLPILRRSVHEQTTLEQSKYSQTDRLGDVFARDLGCMIDAIFKEHSSALQDVIDNIRRSQHTHSHLEIVSRDPIQRCQAEHNDIEPCHPRCRPPYEHYKADQTCRGRPPAQRYGRQMCG